MATHFRIANTDENDAARIQAKKVLKDPSLGKRAVLGELGNKVLKNIELGGKGKDGFKPSEPSFKNVKARVDTHWKKADGGGHKPITRSDSLKSINTIGAAVTALKQTTWRSSATRRTRTRTSCSRASRTLTLTTRGIRCSCRST